MQRIYLDYNATTPLRTEARDAMMPYLTEAFGNGSSIHAYGREARNAIDTAREQVAELIGAKSPSEIVFTGSGTEADNHAIKGLTELQKSRGEGNHIITSSVEHHAVLHTCQYMEQRGYEVTYLPVDRYGRIRTEQLRSAIRDTSILITIMHVNNENGTIQPLEEICEIAQEHEILVHTDAIQSVGKLNVNAQELGVNLLSLSGHKIYAPKGIGVLYIRRGSRLANLVHGGSHERNRRAGSENVPAIVGLGVAAELAKHDRETYSQHLTKLTNRLRDGLNANIERLHYNGHPDYCAPGTLNVSFESVEGESLILRLDMEGICVSTGSACTSGSMEPSHVLAALGLPPRLAQGTVRFSLGRNTTEAEIDTVIEKLPKVIKQMRALYRG
ncbi:cysteine desulfurase NifS [Candidatus Poribacteria bacterium]|nr:cysteine desulfurase NifS [Candidatus Poribacteria bacterium]MYB64387.1 cysteine desulfurase NifS [Candidatus Poribacteria bacterium]MYF55255.1 cysteine desulfurase NifS [Candidatus Poribacteria bacterium]MYI92924.1 cysteine desulfurase NifS [Candidatus Poribacteria bacterium]